MDRKKLAELADYIEINHQTDHRGRPFKFNLSSWISVGECGTAGCIAGWAVHMAEGTEVCLKTPHQVARRAEKILGFEVGAYCDQSRLLFGCGIGDGKASELTGRIDRVTRQQAVNTLRYAAKHGVVHWTTAQQDVVTRAELVELGLVENDAPASSIATVDA